MSTHHLRNIGLDDYIKFLKHIGCNHIRTTGGHYHFSRKDLSRPITVQSHISPVPEFIIKNHLRILELSKKEFLDAFYLM